MQYLCNLSGIYSNINGLYSNSNGIYSNLNGLYSNSVSSMANAFRCNRPSSGHEYRMEYMRAHVSIYYAWQFIIYCGDHREDVGCCSTVIVENMKGVIWSVFL